MSNKSLCGILEKRKAVLGTLEQACGSLYFSKIHAVFFEQIYINLLVQSQDLSAF